MKKNLIKFLSKNGLSAKEIAAKLNINLYAVYKIINKINKENYFKSTANAVYHTEEYKNFREQVLSRDGHKCVKCNKKGTAYNPLQVDHKLAKSTNLDLIFELSNAQTLCRVCHSKQDTTRTFRRFNKTKKRVTS